jgi:hypothetical protein
MGSTQPLSTTEKLLERESRGFGVENREYWRIDPSRHPLSAKVGTNFADCGHVVCFVFVCFRFSAHWHYKLEFKDINKKQTKGNKGGSYISYVIFIRWCRLKYGSRIAGWSGVTPKRRSTTKVVPTVVKTDVQGKNREDQIQHRSQR